MVLFEIMWSMTSVSFTGAFPGSHVAAAGDVIVTRLPPLRERSGPSGLSP
jgi:hypothetical protein